MHSYGVKDRDSPEMWQEIIRYLKTDMMPEHCQDQVEHKSFIQKTKNFFLHNRDRLWKIEMNGKIPRLVVIEVDHRSGLIAEAHNDIGHRGRNATYKTLSEHFFWPNMCDEITYFVRSCNVCQL